MALNTQQIAGLNALNQKIAGGYTASQTDLDNLDYAKDQGYTYNPMPQGATKIASPDQLKGLTESQLYRSGQDIYRLPSTPSEVATNQPSPIIPPAEPMPSVDGLMAGVQTGNQGLQAQLESLQKQLTSQPKATALQAEQEKYRGEQATAQRDLQEQKFQQLGLNENLAQVQAIMPQIARLEADFNRIANENLNRPISSRIIGGTTDRIQRQKAVELAGLSAVAQAYQGNVNLARNIANDAVNAQYQDIQTYNNNLQNQINSVYEDLTREEKVKADQLNLVIAERDRQIEEEKNNATAIQNLAIQSAQAGVDNTIVSNILKSGSISKAIEMAAKAGVYQVLDSTTPIKLTDDLFYDPITKTTKTAKQLTASQLGDKGITSASGNSYDMSTYATDPKQAQAVQKYLNEIGKFNSVEDIDNYIKSVYPNSSITGQMVAEVAAEQGVGWEEVVALAQHESLLGTSNVAKSNNNPGGITWNSNFPASMKGTARPGAEGGNYVKFATMKDGLNSVAYELAKRKVDIVEQPTEAISSRAKLVLDNPALLSNYTNTEKGKIIDELANAGVDTTPLEITALGNTAIKDISQSKDALDGLLDLSAKINDNLQYIGPIKGLAALNPWSKARKVQSDIDRIRQTVGKALEGGVLRKEDEEKYKKILATITDTPETAQYKIAQLIKDIQSNIVNYGKGLGLSEQYVNSKLLDSSLYEQKLLEDNNIIKSSAGTTSSGISYTVE